ncbi:glycosyl transferase [Aspergillus bombycis]|uniref:Glycosyl transferase n=1 Tax=Aspergillus bombycis TaxID=109264 RepID=A0A1F8A307_9EURO|nr:glycosyl transferase [Aspergillus bombycis]OGM46067.1 glycosyl transferase [Aspergillus bombycis]
MPHSLIPLIVHQTWGHRQINTWPEDLRQSVEQWLQFVAEDEVAYFLWEDEGIAEFINHFTPESQEHYASLPSMVEKTDYFRILVATYVGGIYGDLDTVPLKSPARWITSQDVLPWTDLETRSVYNSTKPVRAIFGIEADCLPADRTCWRMGYPYSIQLTQWSFASTRDHPILHRYLENLAHQLQKLANLYGGNLQTSAARAELQALDPLTLTGPEAITYAAQGWLNVSAGLRWNALTGLQDGGKAKLVDDVLILPITSFSPGRGKYGNMGSKPITDPTALVHHHGQGSWKKFNLVAEVGKICRTAFGLCESWSKMQSTT